MRDPESPVAALELQFDPVVNDTLVGGDDRSGQPAASGLSRKAKIWIGILVVVVIGAIFIVRDINSYSRNMDRYRQSLTPTGQAEQACAFQFDIDVQVDPNHYYGLDKNAVIAQCVRDTPTPTVSTP